jgi:thiol:disulfide interchange protein DsbC
MTRLCIAVLLALTGLSLHAAEPAQKPAQQATQKADPRAVIAKKFPGMSVSDVRPSPVPGIYEVRLGADSAYVSADGRYVISGDLFDLDTRENLTEASRTNERRTMLAKLDESEMIIFGPAAAKHTITVFTDVDCGYCRKLHSEIEQLTKLGVRVRYLAYPRSGPGSSDWRKMEAVWCSKDRRTAITAAKRGEEVRAPNCATPVEKHYNLGEDFGVRGTPAVFTMSGDYIGGYLAPAKMKERLDQLQAQR